MAQQFNYGGQAVLEGVMMRGSHRMAVAVRTPDKKIVVHDEEINSPLYSGELSRVPFVRGLGLLWDSLGLGTRALTYSAKVAAGEEAELSDPVTIGALVISMLFAIGLFFVTPLLVADGIRSLATSIADQNASLAWLATPLVRNLIEGVFRLLVVVGYIWGIGRIPDIQRVFAYHGAEHKTINAYEAGAALTPEEVARYPLEHPRCGTGFLLVVMVVSILVFSLLGNPPLVLRYLIRIALVPVVATISYEYIRLTARHIDKPLVRMLVAPQLALQRLTTRQPSQDMLEVSILALKRVLVSEEIPVPGASAVPVDAR
jgi:uncharacterized protein YqhQ